ncbi:MAG: hypothetical protein E7656_01845 [Ruminococcaceae bacterium]|nr:hypothetical protein [Oscillospiraceae bacterium]
MEKISHFSSEENPWGKSRTPKLYISPPLSENIITLWPNSMVVIGEIMGGAESQVYSTGKLAESKLPSSAIAFLHQEQLLDREKCEYKIRPDGIPVHSVVYRTKNAVFETENFADTARVSTVFARLTITNISDEKITETATLVSRTGPEFDLVGICEPDGYTRAEPSYHRIKLLPRWQHSDGLMTDGTYSVYYKAGEKVKTVDSDSFTANYTDKDGIYFNFDLDPGESAHVDVAFGRGDVKKDFSYDKEKEKAISFWETELSHIEVFPNKDDPFTYNVFRALVVQGLQMFNYPKNCDYVIMRQGGLQRRMWPTENRSMIEALAHIGTFEKFHDAILSTYFNVLQAQNGEINNFGVHWASITGAVLYSFSAASQKHKTLFDKYKDGAYKAFVWMQAQRKKADEDPGQTSGLFPADQDSDYPAVAQSWSQTDVWNLQAYEKYAQVLEFYADEHFAEVSAAANDYRNILCGLFARFADEQKDSDYLVLPKDPKNDPELEAYLKPLHPNDGQFGPYILLFSGIAGYGTKDAEKVIRYYDEVLGDHKNGLVLPHNEVNITSKGIQWYLNWLEYKLYFYYRRSGRNDLARPLLQAQFKYGMTNEFYMAERYDDHDAYFTPWCPNCSAAARTILMICDWYGNNLGDL